MLSNTILTLATETTSTRRTNHYMESSKLAMIQARAHFAPSHRTLDPIGNMLILLNRRRILRALAQEPLIRCLRRLEGNLNLLDDPRKESRCRGSA